jgi:predicted CXXCH cytochrome family protein
VPAPQEATAAGTKGVKGTKILVTEKVTIRPKKPAFYFHPPFVEQQCDNCHDTKSSQKLVLPPKKLCVTCHEDFTKNKKTVHYPVSEGACMECHDPHQSTNKTLLKKPVPEICFTCHEEKDIKANPAHEGQTMCTECHNPHASNEEKLLK